MTVVVYDGSDVEISTEKARGRENDTHEGRDRGRQRDVAAACMFSCGARLLPDLSPVTPSANSARETLGVPRARFDDGFIKIVCDAPLPTMLMRRARLTRCLSTAASRSGLKERLIELIPAQQQALKKMKTEHGNKIVDKGAL